MAITECGKGHVYDTDQYAFCPYCNGGGNMIQFGGGSDAGRTVVPGRRGCRSRKNNSAGRLRDSRTGAAGDATLCESGQ